MSRALAALALIATFGPTIARAQGEPPPPVEECAITCDDGDTCVRCGENEDCAYKCLTLCIESLECDVGETCLILETACAGCPIDDPLCDPTLCDGVGKCVLADPPAEGCLTDDDCAAGEFCALVDCAPPCDPDDPTCEPVDCAGGGVCIAEPPPECTTDADCTGDDICVTRTVESCTGSGCACPDDGDNDPSNDPPCDCPPPTEPVCSSETVSFCGPRYLGACEENADCGPGFTCEALELCVCSGGGGDADRAPGEAPAPPPEECTCETAGEKSCVLERVECAADTDCADGLVCVDEGTEAPCAVDNEGNVDCGDGTSSSGAKICAPEGFGEAGGVVRAEDTAAEGEGEGEGEDDDDGFIFDCSHGNARSALPLVALALLLRRRRR